MNRQRPYDFITEKLDQLTGSDTNALWEEMRLVLDERMPEKEDRKRRILAWIFRSQFAVISVSVAIGFSVCLLYNGKKDGSVITTNAVTQTKKTNQKTFVPPVSSSNNSDTEHELNSSLQTSNNSKSEETSTSKDPEQKNNLNSASNTTKINSPATYNSIDGNIALGSTNNTKKKAQQNKQSKEIKNGGTINTYKSLINNLNKNFSSSKSKDTTQVNTTNKENQLRSTSNILITESDTIESSTKYRSQAQIPLLITSTYRFKGIDSAFRNNLVPQINPIRDNLRTKGLVIGAAINFNLPVSRQEMSTVDTKGRQNVLFDYLPSLYVQYHFSEKLYVQTQFQYINPQYTPNLTLFSRTTDLTPDKRQQDAVSLNKLYYLNIPVSVHYSPVNNFYIGIGTQYSYLQRSILTGDQSIWENGLNGWKKTQETKTIFVKSNPQKEIKNDHINNSNGNGGNGGNGNNGGGNGNGNTGGNGNPGNTTTTLTPVDTVATSFRSSDWRFLMDLSYRWHHFNIGFNFNIGLDNYINAQIGTNNLPIKDRNESFQLYLRYNLFDFRKKNHLKKVIPSK
jgi:hypothetical protein